MTFFDGHIVYYPCENGSVALGLVLTDRSLALLDTTLTRTNTCAVTLGGCVFERQGTVVATTLVALTESSDAADIELDMLDIQDALAREYGIHVRPLLGSPHIRALAA